MTHGLPVNHAQILPDGGIPPDGTIVFGRLQQCDFTCERPAESGTYWIARASTAHRGHRARLKAPTGVEPVYQVLQTCA